MSDLRDELSMVAAQMEKWASALPKGNNRVRLEGVIREVRRCTTSWEDTTERVRG